MGICGSSEVSEHQSSPTSGSGGGGGGGGGGRMGNAQMLAECVANWDANYPPVTREQLARQRAEFWDTRVEGRAEMWSALRTAAECGDEKTARAITEASGLTPYDCDQPNALFCYDARGARYDVPMYCLHEPRTLIKTAGAGGAVTAPTPASAPVQSQSLPPATVVTASGLTITPSPALATPIPGQPQPAPASVSAPVPVRAASGSSSSAAAVTAGDVEFKVRLSTGEADIPVALSAAATVGDLKAKIAALRPAIAVAKQRVIVAGALLQNATTITDAKIKRNAIVQIMVTL